MPTLTQPVVVLLTISFVVYGVMVGSAILIRLVTMELTVDILTGHIRLRPGPYKRKAQSPGESGQSRLCAAKRSSP